jgi:Ca2+/Na+ antiporter
VAAMFVNRLGQKYSVTCLFYTLQVGIHILIFFLFTLPKAMWAFGITWCPLFVPAMFRLIWPSGFRGGD